VAAEPLHRLESEPGGRAYGAGATVGDRLYVIVVIRLSISWGERLLGHSKFDRAS